MTFLNSRLLSALFLAGSSLCCATAFATDFTFVVPVNVSHIPSDAYQMNIVCDVVDPIYHIVGQQIVGVPITGGAYSGDVTNAFNALSGMDPAAATTYECWAVFLSHLHPDQSYFARSTAAVTLTFPVQTGAPFYIDTGALPLR